MVKLSRLKVNKFHHVMPGTILRFGGGVNLLLGRNGSGRTTLLELVAAIVSMDFSSLGDEPYDVEFDARFETDEVHGHVVSAAQNDLVHRQIELRLKPAADGADTLRVRVVDTTMTIDRAGETIYDGPASFDQSRRPGMATLLDLVRQISARGVLNQTRTLLAAARLARVRRFDEGLESVQNMIGGAAEIYVMPSEGTGPVGLSFAVPDWFIDAITLRVATGAALPFRVDLSESSAFADILPRLGVTSATAQVEHVQEEGHGAHRFRCTGIEVTQAGETVSYDRLSWGQKRLLALSWYLTASPHAVVIDDLPNGLDHAWIELVLNQIGQRQAFLSASTPVLVGCIRFDSGEDVRRAMTLCHHETREGRPELRWEQLNDKSANAMYRAWKGGAGELGEFVRAKELW